MKGAGILARCMGLRSFSSGSGDLLGCIPLGAGSLLGREARGRFGGAGAEQDGLHIPALLGRQGEGQ